MTEADIRAVVPITNPHTEAIADFFEGMATRARASEFESVFVIAFQANQGQWITAERGKRINRLTTIGMLECLKMDILNTTDAGAS